MIRKKSIGDPALSGLKPKMNNNFENIIRDVSFLIHLELLVIRWKSLKLF